MSRPHGLAVHDHLGADDLRQRPRRAMGSGVQTIIPTCDDTDGVTRTVRRGLVLAVAVFVAIVSGVGSVEGFRELPDGALQGPDGTVYRRTPTRVKRRIGAELAASGAPVVTRVYPDGLTWHGGGEAATVWAAI